MNTQVKTVSIAALALVLAGGVLRAEETAPQTAASRLFSTELKLETGAAATYLNTMTGKDEGGAAGQAKEGADEMAAALARAPDDPETLRALVDRSLLQLYTAKASSRSAAQVSQVADEASFRLQLLQVAQNQRIIALLEELAKRGK